MPQPAPQRYHLRHPERTVLYRTVAGHLETWLARSSAGQFNGQGDAHRPPAFVEQALRNYLTGAATLDNAAVHIGAVAFIHRFGSSLNTHVHFDFGLTSPAAVVSLHRNFAVLFV